MFEFQDTFAPSAPVDPPPRLWVRSVLIAGNYLAPVTLIGTHFQYPWLIVLALCFHGCFAWAVAAPSCDWFGPVVTRFRPTAGRKEAWLTIDDGPAGEATTTLSGELARRGVPATFFVKGESLAREPKIAQTLMAAGHTLANHTHTHPACIFWWLRPARLRKEIDACSEALRKAGVADGRWFRSPVGLKHIFLQPSLARRGMRLIAWSVRGRDGVKCDPDTVMRRVHKSIAPGAIIVLHEGRPRSIETILRVVDELQQEGYAFVIPSDEQLV